VALFNVLFRDVTEQTRYPRCWRRVYIWPKASTKGDLSPLTPTARRLRQLPVRLRKPATNVNSRLANPLERILVFNHEGDIYDTDLHCHWNLNRRHCRDCICDRTGRSPVPKNPIHVNNWWISSARGALLGPFASVKQLAVLLPPRPRAILPGMEAFGRRQPATGMVPVLNWRACGALPLSIRLLPAPRARCPRSVCLASGSPLRRILCADVPLGQCRDKTNNGSLAPQIKTDQRMTSVAR
jgi:hypothetical protein